MKNKIARILGGAIPSARALIMLFVFGLMAFFAAPAQATLDTNLTGLVTDISAYWETIKAIVLAVIIFGICIHYARKLKR